MTLIKVIFANEFALWISYIVTFTYIFKVTQIAEKHLLSGKRWELAKNAQEHLLYRLIISAIASVIHRDLDLYFRGQKFRYEFLTKCSSLWLLCRLIFAVEWHNRERTYFSMSIFSVRYFDKHRLENILLPPHIKSGNCHQPLEMLYIMILTYIFKVTKFEIW